MDTAAFISQLNGHLSHLYSFARKVNELDFAASLNGEFRGAQDAGWSTTITADEVFREISALAQKPKPLTRAEFRVLLMLYCQLSEAGGVYETLKNIMGVVILKPYLLWPFKDLVRVAKTPPRTIGPNANATFRDLATTAKMIGMSRLSSLLEDVFRDDIRNGISHADYILWNDGLRLRNRNGGFANRLSFEEVNAALTRGMGFFQILREYNIASIKSFNPPREIVGRLSVNFPMSWTVSCDVEKGTFGFSSSSPGPVTSEAYKRQAEINSRLGGKVLATFSTEISNVGRQIGDFIEQEGFEPNSALLSSNQLATLVDEIEKLDLWDGRCPLKRSGQVLLASPWGFRWLNEPSEFNDVLEKALLEFGLQTGASAP